MLMRIIPLTSTLFFAEQRDPDLVFGTHDTRQATADRALGFHVPGSPSGT